MTVNPMMARDNLWGVNDTNIKDKYTVYVYLLYAFPKNEMTPVFRESYHNKPGSCP